MEFDTPKTATAFLLIVAVGAGGLAASDVMLLETVLMMVLPSMLAFGGISLLLGVKHGEYRAGG